MSHENYFPVGNARCQCYNKPIMEQKAVIPALDNWAEKSVREFEGSPVKRIADEWMLITAGNAARREGNWNTMTASWGALGELWNKDVVFVFIRPGRLTRSFVEDDSLFTLSFFDEKYRKALVFCGEKSGRDYDKAAETGLTPIVFGSGIAGGRAAGAIAFQEASEIIVCRKIYTQDIEPERFLDSAIGENYPQKDYHRMFVGEVLTLLTAK
jgi:flavin reductase (DIM6/NTAB) family NADH-FMN oxidoreductase RutF